MEVVWGLLIIAVGSFGQSSSYVPINKVKAWSWESFWLVQGVFAWLVFPWLGALLGVPEGDTLPGLWRQGNVPLVMLYGVLWGIGGLTFGLSMRYLGVALGQSIALGTCSAFGTLLPALWGGTDLFRGQGLLLLAFSWSILMALNVTFSNVWGILLKEWKGCGRRTVAVLVAGLAVLVGSIVLVAVAQQ